jgi:hypothetical protein
VKLLSKCVAVKKPSVETQAAEAAVIWEDMMMTIYFSLKGLWSHSERQGRVGQAISEGDRLNPPANVADD